MDCPPTPAQVHTQVPVPSPVASPIDGNENIIDCPDEWVDIQPTVHVSSINEIEDISTETLLHDLRTIVINEIGDKFSQELVSSFSGKTFTEAEVSSVFQKILEEESNMVKIDTIAVPITVDLPPIDDSKVSNTTLSTGTSNTDEPEKDIDKVPEKKEKDKAPDKKGPEKKVKEKKAPSNKPKRKNKIAAYNVFKKDPEMKKKIDEIYIPRKELDKSLKFSAVAAEVWKTIDKTPFEKIADDLNEKNATSLPIPHTQLQKDP